MRVKRLKSAHPWLRPLLYTALVGVLFNACDGGPRGNVPAPSLSPSPVRLPTAGKLVFSDGTDLYRSAPDGSNRVRITRDGEGGFYAGGRWSPDGKLVAAERGLPSESGPQLFIVDPATGESKRVSPAGTWLDGFGWSPDGTRVVYASLTSGGTLASGGTLQPEKGDVRVYEVTSGTQRVVGPGVHPSWSPDGARIAYVHAAGAIAVSAPDGGEMKWIASLPDLNRTFASFAPNGYRFLSGPAWSRDGKRIAFSGIEAGPILDAIQVVFVGAPVAGAPLKPFSLGRTGAQHHVVNLSWSPAADVLGYASIYAGPHHHVIGTIDPAKSQAQPLFDSSRHFLDFTWSPDGSVMLLAIDEQHAFAVIRTDRPRDDPPRFESAGFRPDWCCKENAPAR